MTENIKVYSNKYAHEESIFSNRFSPVKKKCIRDSVYFCLHNDEKFPYQLPTEVQHADFLSSISLIEHHNRHSEAVAATAGNLLLTLVPS